MDCVAAKILTTLGANLQKIYQEIFETVGIDPKMYQEEYGPEEGRKNGVLDQYGTDLTAEAEEGKLDPVIGRKRRNRTADAGLKQTHKKQSLSGRGTGGW